MSCIMFSSSACSSDLHRAASETSAATESSHEARFRETSGGGYHVVYAPVPEPIPLNSIFALDVWVYRDAERKTPAGDVSIVADAAMPAHHHGMTLVPRAERLGDGHFRVNGMLFHMPGAWEIYIDVREGEKVERARFEVEL
jgi:hypothetical protein